MAKLNNSSPNAPPSVILDTDVVINWLAKEEDAVLNKELWKSPHKIIELIEEGKIRGFSTIINLLEVRFVLRRKKSFGEDKIKGDIAKILKLLKIIVPDEVNLLKANGLQDEFSLSPFDAILLATILAKEDIVLVSRDKILLSIASKFLEVTTPEKFLEGNFPPAP